MSFCSGCEGKTVGGGGGGGGGEGGGGGSGGGFQSQLNMDSHTLSQS